jgi:hypothetical protein
MLWYKAWLETRLRVLLIFSVILFVLYQVHSHGGSSLSAPSLLNSLEFVWVISFMTFAGSGIRPESPFRMVKGIQGSMYYTLSLPVSRLRLLLVRATVGILEIAGLIAAAICIAALAAPEMRAQVTAADGIRYALTVLLCSSAAFGVSTLFATFLDQQWQAFASMFVIFLSRWLFTQYGKHPSPYDFYRAMGTASPLVTHALPWTAIGVSVAIGAACFMTAIKVEQIRQY